MKVKELIEKLKKMPQEAEVITETCCELKLSEVKSVVLYNNAQWKEYFGKVFIATTEWEVK